MQPDSYVTLEAYLALDADADVKHEYWDGQVIAMAGAEPEHNQLTANLATEFNTRLRSQGCRVAVADQRVRVGQSYVYPDVVVVCRDPDYLDTRPRTLTNPELIVEVLSSSTTERDLEDKLLAYTRLDSLKEYWIVSSARPLVMRYARRDQEWVLHAVLGMETTVQSDHFGLEIPMIDLYALVFDEASASRQ